MSEINSIEKEIWHKIDGKNGLKNKIESLETIYNTIQNENKRYAKFHNGSRIPELSRMAGPLFQTIGNLKKQIETPVKTHTVIIG